MKYISTRGRSPAMGYQEAVMTGLASDGGLIIPAELPQVAGELERWADLPYPRLAFEITRMFADIPDDDLWPLIENSYATFRHPGICPLVKLDDLYVLELFHGPTLAFKDIALQCLGNVFEYILERTHHRLNILAATSGDTGSAAIHGVRGKEKINIFVMHPRGRISPTQERQMTSVLDGNVFNMAIHGTFDDCQRMMKNIFRDVAFKRRYELGAVNSVNWARVLAQIVYYFHAGLRVMREERSDRVAFSVPTGNFGDILAGYYAARMGLPVERLILATNENDILSRFFNTGVYSLGPVVHTLSPSMDIQVASNFERYLYYLVGERGEAIESLMHAFDQTGQLEVPLREGRVDALFAANAATKEDTLATIRRYHQRHAYLLDPHTATGISVAERQPGVTSPVVCLATAHPAKFSQAIQDALGCDLAHHELLDALEGADTRCAQLDADEYLIREYIREQIEKSAGIGEGA